MRTDKPYISLVINLDTRPERSEFGGNNLTGVVSRDFIEYGVFNKMKPFQEYGYDFETVVFIDKHEDIPIETLNYLYKICDTVCVRKHTDEEKFNDKNYTSAIALCRGEILFHFDSDLGFFVSSKEAIQEQIDLLEKHDFVSYPTTFSPNPDNNPNYNYWWCSSRYYVCKRKTLDLTEIEKCLDDYDYLYETYPASVKNGWFEHIISLINKYRNGKGVYYPPLDYSKALIFCFDNYEKWLLRRLNEQSYDEVKNWVLQNGGIFYPNQLRIR